MISGPSKIHMFKTEGDRIVDEGFPIFAPYFKGKSIRWTMKKRARSLGALIYSIYGDGKIVPQVYLLWPTQTLNFGLHKCFYSVSSFRNPKFMSKFLPRIEFVDGYFHTGWLVIKIVGGDHQLDFFQ